MPEAHETYTPPSFQSDGFNCPHSDCGVYARQVWWVVTTQGRNYNDWDTSRCDRCGELAFWHSGELVYPLLRRGASPNPDMPDAVREVYNEARAVSPISRKSSAGLLRLALQMLIDDLEPGPGTINTKIGTLVDKGLPVPIQQAMDALRVIGNESVHPGQIDLDGADEATVAALFKLLNVIVEDRISTPKQVSEMYDLIPEDKRKGIEDRDKPKD